MSDMKRFLDPRGLALEKAVAVVEKARPLPAPRPEDDARLVALRQMYEMASATLTRAELTEYQAKLAKLAALDSVLDLKVRIELLEQDLGIRREDGEEDEHETHLGADATSPGAA